MRKLTFGLLIMSGFLMAQDQPAQPRHLSEDQRIALRTQSPPVKTHGRHSKKKSDYNVTENKTTIVATKTFAQ